MRKRISWSFAVGLVGAFLAEKGTYWLPGTYLADLGALTFGFLGGAIAGFLLGCIVEKTRDEQHRRLKILYWVLATAILGVYLGVGKGASPSISITVIVSALGLGLVLGIVQYFAFHPTRGSAAL